MNFYLLSSISSAGGVRCAPPACCVPTEQAGAVLQLIYHLVFNEGSSAAGGATVRWVELTSEAVRLNLFLTELLPKQEVLGLLSLLSLKEPGRAARTSPAPDLLLVESQDRSLGNPEQIAEGVALSERAQKSRHFGSYPLRAATAAVHAEAESVAVSDGRQIVAI
jgi:RNA polymerase sigma-70 factor (ECF subfamily)